MKKFLIIILCCLAMAAQAENVVSVSSASGHPQDEVTFNVSLANTDAAVAFQTEIPLGSQLTYVAGSVALNPDRVTDHHVTAAVVNGTLKIYAYSLSLTPFVGNEGNLLSFTLKLKNEPADYALNLSNVKLSDASGAALPVTTQSGTVTILSPKLSINTPSLNYGHVPIRSEYTKTAQVSNVGNEPLTITNITFSDAVFTCPSFAETTLQPGANASFTFKFAPMLKGAVTATATIVSNSISGNGTINLLADPYAVNEIHVGNVTGYCDSIVELPISMNNMEDIIGFQIEFNLNDALEFVDFTLSDRKTNHVETGVVVGTTLRLMAYSPTGAAFTDEDGVIGILRFRLHGLYGNYYLNPYKAILADTNGEDALSAKYQGQINIRSPRINGNSSLSFGSTPVTETVTKEYVVGNNGNAPMRIDQVVFDQEGCSVEESFPITVNQYASATLHVSHSREQKGDFNALMKIYSNDPQSGLKNVALSGNRYEPNSVGLEADPFVLDDGDVLVSLNLDNYSDIVALQADFSYPNQDYSVSPADFHLTDRFANHSLYVIQTNDSTYRILILSMQNAAVEGHEGAALNITLHPIGTLSDEEYTVSVSNIVLSETEGLNVFTGEEVSADFSLTVTQSQTLSQGWNWWSTYIEQEGVDGLGMLENGLGHNGLAIKSQNDFTTNYYGSIGYDYWYGGLESLTNEQGYMINTSAAANVVLTGVSAKPADHPITIHPNWNWIGYPASQEQLLTATTAGFQPENNDVVKDHSGFAMYYAGYGWYPQDFVMTPGKGYLYNSNATGDKVLTYAINRESASFEKKPNECQWVPETHKYADNISVIAVLEKEGEELRDNVEVGAFVNGECRGTAMLRYFEPTGRYYAMLSVAGEDGDEVSFEILGSRSATRVVFRSNDVLGSLDQPFVMAFCGGNAAMSVGMYPNPVDRNDAIMLDLLEDVRISEIVIVDMLGRTVRCETDGLNIIGGLSESGVYFVEIATNKVVYHGRLIVK